MLFLELIAENYSRVLIKNHGMAFIDKVFEVGFKIASEDPALYEGQDDAPPYFAVNMVYTYACVVHTEKVFPIIMKYLQQYAISKNEHERAAATTILGQIADPEACLDHVRDHINSLTNFIIDRMQDESFLVREAAGETVGRFSEHVGEDFIKSHKKIMPCLMRVVKDMANSKHEMTVQKTLFALNEFVQQLDYDIKVYLDDLITILVGYATSQFSRDVKYWALISLQSTIATSQKKILPYMNQLLEVITGIINLQGNVADVQLVKGQALMCAGRLASACGRDVFPAQAIEGFTMFGLECLKSNDKFELKETAFTYFSDLSVLLKEEMAPVFDQVINTILETMYAEDEHEQVKDETKDPTKGFSLDSDSENDFVGLNVNLNQVDEKAAAVNAMGIIAMNAPKLIQTRMKDILEAQEKLHHYFHENVKFHVCQAYNQITLGMIRNHGLLNSEDKFIWTKGSPANSPLPQDVMDFLNRIVFPYFFSLFDQEDNKEVIERTLSNMTELTIDFGPGVFANQMEAITKYIILFLQKKTYCQGGLGEEDGDDHEDVHDEEDEDDYGDEEGDDGINHDEVILGNITDLIFETARSFGNEFAPFFQ